MFKNENKFLCDYTESMLNFNLVIIPFVDKNERISIYAGGRTSGFSEDWSTDPDSGGQQIV